MKDDLQTLFGQEVNVLVKAAIERSDNWLRRERRWAI
jgi:predicted nucleotidyltransferase